LFITEHPNSFLELVSTDWKPQIQLNFAKDKGIEKPSETLKLEDLIAIKGLKAIGNRLTTYKVKNIDLLEPLPYQEIVEEEEIIEDELLAEEEDDLENEMDTSEDEDIEESEESQDLSLEIVLPSVEKKEKKTPIKPILDDDSETQMTLF
jgi:topoisomerase-4 subunit A